MSLQTITEIHTRIRLSLEASQSIIILNDKEEKTVREVLYEERERLNQLDQDIRYLDPIPGKLHEQRKACIERIDLLSTALSLQKRLPSEILATIFVDLQGGEPAVLPPDRTKSPWALRCVCSQWRKVAIAEFSLWSNLIVEERRSKDVVTDWIPQLWNQGDIFPVSLNLGSLSINNGPSLCDTLAPYFYRIRVFSFDMLSESIPSIITDHSYCFDSLESLTLNIRNYWHYRQVSPSPLQEQSVALLTSAQKLRTVAFTSPLPDIYTLSPYKLPWNQLTELVFRRICLPARALKTILQKCNNLVSLTFTSFYDRSELHSLSTPAPDVYLPYLEHLTVVLEGGSSYWDVFELLHVPLLNKFSIINPDTGYQFPWDSIAFINMIKFSGSRIRSLNLSGPIQLPLEMLIAELPDLVEIVLPHSTPVSYITFEMIVSWGKTRYLECFTQTPALFLRHLENHLINRDPEGFSGLLTANISYPPPATENELEELNDNYSRLMPQLVNGKRNIIFRRLSPGSSTFV